MTIPHRKYLPLSSCILWCFVPSSQKMVSACSFFFRFLISRLIFRQTPALFRSFRMLRRCSLPSKNAILVKMSMMIFPFLNKYIFICWIFLYNKCNKETARIKCTLLSYPVHRYTPFHNKNARLFFNNRAHPTSSVRRSIIAMIRPPMIS